ncbi:hypothetical protein TCAL_08329 [Tigriopus californicus]|uniref:Elongation of very long chain fatty acids protein n=2 Tax=Tigriopus californicus TaxID=6832 RepID=A0A553PPT7_TIGCA|nr:elongation of very long chain fatty acids protein 7-like isoform X2 [Tigriopus californicus]TRY79697.1 hypothetical protein TCAL_08329 [Tigriopus californicus]
MNRILEDIWDARDLRMDSYPLMNSPLPTIALCCLYFYGVKFLGPRLMKDKKAWEIKNVLIGYNLVQVIFSGWILFEILMGGWAGAYSFRCEPLDRSDNAMALRMANAAWWYYFSKFTEFFDTFFFIVRKKTEHVSTLHVLHHGLMPLFAWEACRFVPGGHESFGALFNTFVHVVMYTYYFLAAFGPRFQRYLWWKRHLTKFQMFQFVSVTLHSLQLAFSNECNFPVYQSMISSGFMVLFFILFMQFYFRNYKKKTALAAKSQ